MELTFATPELEVAANSSQKLQQLFGAHAPRVGQRLYELAAADNLAVAMKIPTLRIAPAPHGRFVVPLPEPGRLVFRLHADTTRRAGASHEPDLQEVTAIEIVVLG